MSGRRCSVFVWVIAINVTLLAFSATLSCAEDMSGNNMWGDPRETPLTMEARSAKKEIAELLRKHGAKE